MKFFKKHARYNLCFSAYAMMYSGFEITNKQFHGATFR